MTWEDLKWITHWILVIPIAYLWIEVQALTNKLNQTKNLEAASEERFKKVEEDLREVKDGVKYLVRRELEKVQENRP